MLRSQRAHADIHHTAEAPCRQSVPFLTQPCGGRYVPGVYAQNRYSRTWRDVIRPYFNEEPATGPGRPVRGFVVSGDRGDDA